MCFGDPVALDLVQLCSEVSVLQVVGRKAPHPVLWVGGPWHHPGGVAVHTLTWQDTHKAQL